MAKRPDPTGFSALRSLGQNGGRTGRLRWAVYSPPPCDDARACGQIRAFFFSLMTAKAFRLIFRQLSSENNLRAAVDCFRAAQVAPMVGRRLVFPQKRLLPILLPGSLRLRLSPANGVFSCRPDCAPLHSYQDVNRPPSRLLPPRQSEYRYGPCPRIPRPAHGQAS